MSDHPVTKGHLVLNDEGKFDLHMQDTGILDAAVRTDPDIVLISPNKAVKPDIGTRPNLHIADDRGILNNKRRGIYLGIFPFIVQNHFLTPFKNVKKTRFRINIIRTRIKKQDRAMGPCLVMGCLKTDLNLKLS
jgi:hypothetical protein